jgi:hypothetical protein
MPPSASASTETPATKSGPIGLPSAVLIEPSASYAAYPRAIIPQCARGANYRCRAWEKVPGGRVNGYAKVALAGTFCLDGDPVRTLIRWAGDNPDRDGLVDTPARVVRAYDEWFAGYGEDPAEFLQRTFVEGPEMTR